MRIDCVFVAVVLITPDLVEQFQARKNATRMPCKKIQQVEFARCQFHGFAVDLHLAVDRVILEEQKWVTIVNEFGTPLEKNRKMTLVYRFTDVPNICFAIAGTQIESSEARYREDPKWVRLFTHGEWHSPAGEIVRCSS